MLSHMDMPYLKMPRLLLLRLLLLLLPLLLAHLGLLAGASCTGTIGSTGSGAACMLWLCCWICCMYKVRCSWRRLAEARAVEPGTRGRATSA